MNKKNIARKNTVRKKLFKIRQSQQQNKKIEKETQNLKRETDKISNKGLTIRMPERVVGAFVPVQTDIQEGTIVSFVYAKNQEYAKVLNSDTLLLLSESEASGSLECVCKNGILRPKKRLTPSI